MTSINQTISSAFDQYSSQVNRYIYTKTHCTVIAEDLTQETYIKLILAKDLSTVRNVKSYLFRIAKNLIIDHYRSTKAKYAPTELCELIESDFVSEDPDSETHALYHEQIMEAANQISGLSELCQKVFWLRHLYGYRNYEIAQMEGICLSTVEKNISRATKSLASTC